MNEHATTIKHNDEHANATKYNSEWNANGLNDERANTTITSSTTPLVRTNTPTSTGTMNARIPMGIVSVCWNDDASFR